MPTALSARSRLRDYLPHTMAEGNQVAGPEPFNLEDWAIQHGLSRKTTGTLRREEYESLAALKLMTAGDINRIDIAVGQIRILRTALRELGNPILVVDPTEPPKDNGAPNVSVHEEDVEENPLEGDNNEQVLQDAGDHLALLLQPNAEEDELTNQDLPLPTSKPAQNKTTLNFSPYNPLMHLTVKAARKKALQIEQFLSETVRTRVNRKKKDHLTFTSTPGGGLTLKTDDHSSVYVTIAEWNGANMRLCAHMLKKGMIREKELIYYMAYTAMIADLAGRYEWASILDYDVRYRELQAEHGFPWGTPHPHAEQHILIPRHHDNGGKGRSQMTTANSKKKRTKINQPCRKWFARGECEFGEDCIYQHERSPSTTVKATPKNE